MSLEAYAVHIAPRGGKIDLVVDAINGERERALKARHEFAKSKGSFGTYGTDHGVTALAFKADSALPDGYVRVCDCKGGIIAESKAKDRTKAERHNHAIRKKELADLPRLPGASEFSHNIGCGEVFGAHDSGRGMCLRSAFYERIGEVTFVFTPWFTKQEETGNLDDDNKARTAFHPEGCDRVGLSAYYAAKEARKPAEAIA